MRYRGASNGTPTQDASKTHLDLHRFFDAFLHRFLEPFRPQLASQNQAKSRKIDAKTHFIFESIFGSISNAFWDPTWAPKFTKNINFSLIFVGFRENRPFEVNIDFRQDFDANLPPFSLRKIQPNRIKN